jgi:hypothetical protein
MPVRVSWDDEKQSVVRMEFTGKWSWDEMYKATEESVKLRKSKSYQCALIMDMMDGMHIPSGALTHMRNAMSMSSEDREVTVVVTDKQFVKTLATMFMKLYKKLGDKLVVVESLPEARAAIQEWRAAEE